MTKPPAAWISFTSSRSSRTVPSAAGYCSTTANAPDFAASRADPATTSNPSGAQRVRTTSAVCANTSSATKTRSLFVFAMRWHSVTASAAAVASSSIDAFAIAMPVRSVSIVWKLTSASSRPCEISGWYGVYAVYHAGFSSTLRRMTGGVTVP